MNEDIIQQLQTAGKYIIEKGLSWGNAGNLSARSGENRLIITASGTCLDDLQPSDFLEVTLDGILIDGIGKPSKETPFHCAAYQEREDIHTVLHASPLYTTLISCTNLEIPNDLFVEDMYYLERVARVEYAHPGTQALAEGVRARVRHSNVLILNNHGAIVVDSSIDEVLSAMHTLEVTCQMLVLKFKGDMPFNPVPAPMVQDFLENSGYRPRRQWRQ